jgi:hypothetical protein
MDALYLGKYSHIATNKSSMEKNISYVFRLYYCLGLQW